MPIDDDELYDDDYWGYEGWEPTEEQKLAIYVEDDAADSESNSLAWRQNERWAAFRERQEADVQRAQESLDRARQKKKYPGPTWWKVFTPPKLELDRPKAREEDSRIIKQGDLSINTEIKYRDIYYDWGSSPLTTLMESYQEWMDFRPDQRWGFPDLSFLNGRIITPELMYGPWGWWDHEKMCFRSRIWGARSRTTETGEQELAVAMVHPPPYGLWLPVLDLGLSE